MNFLCLSLRHHPLTALCLGTLFLGGPAPLAFAQHDDHAGHGHAAEIDHDDHDDHGDHGGHDDHGGPIELSAHDIQDFGIRLETAGPGTIHEELRLPGEVRMNENAMGHVSPRFAGIVTQIHHRLGDDVEAGAVLATMESNETLRPFDLVSPIDGTVVAFHITPGESLAPGEVTYLIADTRTVWIDLRVYQRDLPQVHPGQTVHLSAGHEYPAAVGTVAYVGPTVDEVSRTGLIRIVLPNPDGHFRPGLFLVGKVRLDEYPRPVVVPRSAVHTMEDADVVFIETADGRGFEAQPVHLGRSDAERVEISEGLQPGQRYVAVGGFFLKAHSQKENFGDGHNH